MDLLFRGDSREDIGGKSAVFGDGVGGDSVLEESLLGELYYTDW